MKKAVLAIDQGTTSTRAIVFNHQSEVLAKAQLEVKLRHPKNGWVEQNPEEIFETVISVVKEAMNLANITPQMIASIGITNQRETTIIWNKQTHKPIYPAIVWQSSQSQPICDAWIEAGFETQVNQKTGLRINPYFSASKIRFILDDYVKKHPDISIDDLAFGTVDSYILYRLTQGKVHATDVSNASRTMLFNIHTLTWDEELCQLFGIPMTLLPCVFPTQHAYGSTTLFGHEIPIHALVGDQQASLFGQTCFEEGSVKNTYGTGCFMLMNTRHQPIKSNHGLLTTIAWMREGEVTYALEGSVFVAGAAVQWLRDGLRMFEKSSDCELYVKRINDTQGVVVVPAFVGLGTPYWDSEARGAVFGLSRSTQKEHLIKATLDAIAYQSKDVMEVMQEESGLIIPKLAVDGGAATNDYLMQFQSDLLQKTLIRPACFETTALGAAYFAGLDVGFWDSLETIKKLHRVDTLFMPNEDKAAMDSLYDAWKCAVKATLMFKPHK